MNDRQRSLRELAARFGGTALVLVILGGLGYWGHRTGWRAPKLAEIRGAGVQEAEDWCEAHNVPDSKCLACHPELGGEDPQDWCREHGVPESKCTVCHPEILTSGTASDWCREHGVPESQCTLCHPEIAVKGQAPAPIADVTAAPGENGSAPTNPLTCQTHAIRIQFASAAAVEKAGIRFEAVQERPVADSVTALGEVEYDQTRTARLSARAAGTVTRIIKDFGQPVARGDILALVDAAEVGRAKAELLQALVLRDSSKALLERATFLATEADRLAEVRASAADRLEATTKEGFRSQAELQEAQAQLQEARLEAARSHADTEKTRAALAEAEIQFHNARQTLLNLGLELDRTDLEGTTRDELAERIQFLGIPDDVAVPLKGSQSSANLLPVIAPFDGIVVSRDASTGEQVDPSKSLFVVSDVRRVWIALDVRQEDAGRIASGQPVIFRPDGATEDAVRGSVSWISSAVDERTRTVRVRADVDNLEGRLRTGVFGTGRIVVRQSPSAVAVPDAAIHWEGCCHVVFVRLTDEIFQTRKVRLGARAGAYTEVLVGVLPGELIATSGSHVLKSEMLKSRLGAGCVDD
jgi:membrane fusion protein, heavy metal efflux system